jgi:hypothetical protein
MKNLVYILVICITITGCQSCKKDKIIPTPISSQNPGGYQALKDLCYFKTGSYWVYQDSIHPTEYDSVYVIQYGINWDTLHTEAICVKPGIYELFGTKTKNSKGETRDFICQSEEAYICNKNGRLTVQNGAGYVAPFISSWFIPGYIILDVPANGTLNYGGRITYVNNYDSINLSGKYYKNIREVNHFSFQYYGSSTTIYSYKYNTNFYLANHVGIVKMVEIDSNRVWNLVRYHVIQ